jgi:hypothetical protein
MFPSIFIVSYFNEQCINSYLH